MTDYHWENCATCHIRYAFPMSLFHEGMKERAKKSIYCPMGHGWHYTGESDADRERRLRQRAEQENARLAEAAAAAERAVKRAKAELIRHKRRAAAGTCPCCNRTFANMAAHMKTKHPDYNVVQLNAKA